MPPAVCQMVALTMQAVGRWKHSRWPRRYGRGGRYRQTHDDDKDSVRKVYSIRYRGWQRPRVPDDHTAVVAGLVETSRGLAAEGDRPQAGWVLRCSVRVGVAGGEFGGQPPVLARTSPACAPRGRRQLTAEVGSALGLEELPVVVEMVDVPRAPGTMRVADPAHPRRGAQRSESLRGDELPDYGLDGRSGVHPRERWGSVPVGEGEGDDRALGVLGQDVGSWRGGLNE